MGKYHVWPYEEKHLYFIPYIYNSVFLLNYQLTLVTLIESINPLTADQLFSILLYEFYFKY